MGLCKALAILVAIVAVLVGYSIFSVPVTDDMSNKTEARLINGIIGKFTVALGEVLSLFGMSKINVTRAVHSASYMFNKNNQNVTMREDIFDGVPVKIYEPIEGKRSGGAIVYIHGGGWVYLSTDGYHHQLQQLTDESKFMVVSPDYRLAPEHRYPAAFDDCQKVVKYLLKHAKKFNIDPRRVALMGDSAGGNLAAAVTIAMRDENSSLMPKIQVLVYPVLQGLDFNTPSYQNDTRIVLSREDMNFFVLAYLLGLRLEDIDENLLRICNSNKLYSESVWLDHGQKILHNALPSRNFPKHYKKVPVPVGNVGFSNELDKLVVQPTFSPLMADDLNGLSETLFLTCQYDVLRDDSFLYASRLRQAGVKVEHDHDMHCYHGAMSVTRGDQPHQLMVKAVRYLVKNL